MTNRTTAVLTAGLLAAASLSFGQRVKSQKEGDAVMAIQNAAEPDAKIAAIENLLTKFADTEFKVIVLEMAFETARSKNDLVQATLYCERTLDADPNNLNALSTLAKLTADTTRENDLDKEEKLKRATDLAKKVITLAPTAKKSTVLLTDEQWASRTKDLASQAHEALASVAMVRKKTDEAIAEYKLAMESAATPDYVTMVRLAMVYNQAQKYDDAIALLDKVIATTDNPQVKQVAGQEKVKAAMAKAAQKK